MASLDYENKDLVEKRHRNEAAIQRQTEQVREGNHESVAISRTVILKYVPGIVGVKVMPAFPHCALA